MTLLATIAVAVVAAYLPAVSGAPRAAAQGDPSCAEPTDCRLREAATRSGLHFGLAASNGGPLHRPTLVAEADLVINHELSWVGIEPERGVWDFTKADENYQFAEDNGLRQVAMHFAWDNVYLDDMPPWVAEITDPDELRDVLRTRARTIFDRYPGLDAIDVINEPFQTLGHELVPNHFRTVLGDDYIHELFAIVEAEAPADVELFVNEGGIDYQPEKADALVALVADLLAAGHRVDTVGLQTHLSVGEPNWALLYHTMTRLEALGVRPWISEVDAPVPDTIEHRDEVQAERYRRVTEICLAVPSCDTINVWGVSDVDNWYDWALYPGLDPLLFDADFEPKPAYFAVRDQLLAGRPAVPGPPDFLLIQERSLRSGEASVTYTMSCAPTTDPVPLGLPELAAPTDLFLSGTPLRMPVEAELRWTPTASAGDAITYQATLSFDLGEAARIVREETARPAIGLGGYPDLVDTVWLELLNRPAVLGFDHPTGTSPKGEPVLTTGAGAPTAASDGDGVTVTIPTLDVDTRSPAGPLAIDLTWSVSAPPSATDIVVRLPAPTLQLELEAHLGVVFEGLEVYGGITAPVRCTAEGTVPILETVVRGRQTGTGPTSTTPTPAAPSVPAPARSRPAFAG